MTYLYIGHMMDLAILEKNLLALPESERAVLIDRMLSSLSPQSADQRKLWTDKIDSRLNAFKDGNIEALDGPAAIAELKANLTK